MQTRSLRWALGAGGAAVLPGAAAATTFNEGADFPDDPAAPALLPTGTDIVLGYLDDGESATDPLDAFRFQSLNPGKSWTLEISTNTQVTLSELDGSGGTLFQTTASGGSASSLSGTVPAGGTLDFSVELLGNPTASWTAQLSVPEPGTGLLLATGMVAAILAKRFSGPVPKGEDSE